MNTSDPRKIPFPPLIPAAALLLAWRLQKLWPIEITWPDWSRAVGWTLVAAPTLVAIWAHLTFVRFHTTVNPRGDVKTIVDSGPFRFTRNPMYLSLLLMFIGFSLAMHLAWGFLLLVPVVLALRYAVILPEEKYLERKFGEKYLLYKRRVKRWV